MIIITEPPSLLKSFIAKISLNELARTMAINLGLNVAARILRREDVRALETCRAWGFEDVTRHQVCRRNCDTELVALIATSSLSR
jgi:hypothetical protein